MLAADVQHLRPIIEGAERRDAGLRRQRENPVLTRPGILAAHLDDLAVTNRMTEHPATDPVPCLKNVNRAPGRDQVACGDQAGQPSPDHQDVRRMPHPPSPSPPARRPAMPQQRRGSAPAPRLSTSAAAEHRRR